MHYLIRNPYFPKILFCKDVFNIRKDELFKQLEIAREIFQNGSFDARNAARIQMYRYNTKISEMGYFSNRPMKRELRPVFEKPSSKPFGSPYKRNEKISVDEADDDASDSSVSPTKQKLTLTKIRQRRKHRLHSDTESEVSTDTEVESVADITSVDIVISEASFRDINVGEIRLAIRKSSASDISQCFLALKKSLEGKNVQIKEAIISYLKTEAKRFKSSYIDLFDSLKE
jgi:hypothetical protein